MKKKIALFGLSANPPTGNSGHRGIVRSLFEKGIFDEIVVLPVYRHMYPEKNLLLQPFEHRMKMCVINFESLNSESSTCRVRVSEFEKTLYHLTEEKLRVSDPSYFNADGSLNRPFRMGTMEIIEGLRDLVYPPSDFTIHLILGSDAFKDIMDGKWTRDTDLLDAVYLEVFYRVNIPLDVEKNPSKYPLRQRAKVTFHSVDSLGPISSTEVRKTSLNSIDRNIHVTNREISKLLRRNIEIPIVRSNSLSELYPDVLNYMIDNGLYGFHETKAFKLQAAFLIVSIGLLMTLHRLSLNKK